MLCGLGSGQEQMSSVPSLEEDEVEIVDPRDNMNILERLQSTDEFWIIYYAILHIPVAIVLWVLFTRYLPYRRRRLQELRERQRRAEQRILMWQGNIPNVDPERDFGSESSSTLSLVDPPPLSTTSGMITDLQRAGPSGTSFFAVHPPPDSPPTGKRSSSPPMPKVQQKTKRPRAQSDPDAYSDQTEMYTYNLRSSSARRRHVGSTSSEPAGSTEFVCGRQDVSLNYSGVSSGFGSGTSSPAFRPESARRERRPSSPDHSDGIMIETEEEHVQPEGGDDGDDDVFDT